MGLWNWILGHFFPNGCSYLLHYTFSSCSPCQHLTFSSLTSLGDDGGCEICPATINFMVVAGRKGKWNATCLGAVTPFVQCLQVSQQHLIRHCGKCSAGIDGWQGHRLPRVPKKNWGQPWMGHHTKSICTCSLCASVLEVLPSTACSIHSPTLYPLYERTYVGFV